MYHNMLRVYHLSEETREEKNVYIHEEDTRYGGSPYKLYSE